MARYTILRSARSRGDERSDRHGRIICPDEVPFLGFLSLVLPVLSRGEYWVVVPSETYPLIAGDLYQVFDTSDLSGGAVNIVTGYHQILKTLAEHDGHRRDLVFFG